MGKHSGLKIRRSNPCRFESGPGHHEAFAMIIYDLCCENDHKLEGWFASAQDFESQLASGMIRCPQCDSIDLRRVPSAVAIGGHAEPAPLPPEPETAPPSPLSPREEDVLREIARGASNKEIARTLDIAETTVKIHVQHILRKLGLSSRVQAAVYASDRQRGDAE